MVSGVRQNADNQNLNFVQTLLFEYARLEEIIQRRPGLSEKDHFGGITIQTS